MTGKQQFLKIVYPLFALFTRIFKINKGIFKSDKPALQSFYTLQATLNDGQEFNFSQLKNKKILIVNTASDCGFTPQYDELEKLFNLKKDILQILAFPANDFQKQESKDDNVIAEFCKQNYGITFPLMKKSKVTIHSTQNKVYDWLTDREKNGWNSNEPSWNFCKYLVDENGNLTHFFESSESPMGKNILAAIEE